MRRGGLERGSGEGEEKRSEWRVCIWTEDLPDQHTSYGGPKVRCPKGQEPLSEGRSYLTFVPTHRHTCPTDNWNGIFLPSTHLSGGHFMLTDWCVSFHILSESLSARFGILREHTHTTNSVHPHKCACTHKQDAYKELCLGLG